MRFQPIVESFRRSYTLFMPETTQPDATGDAKKLWNQVEQAINLIRPAIQADGGDIELVDILTSGAVHVRFHGACQGCPSASMTLHMGIERVVREHVPQVTEVIAVD